MKISPEKFLEINKKNYNLDIIYLLSLIENKIDISLLTSESVKISALYQSLIRKGLVNDSGDKLTTIGKDLLKFLDEEDSVKFIKKKTSTDFFEKWWQAFPGTDKFSYKGKSFSGSRSLRQNKENCKIKFNKIILEGDYTAEQVINALLYDVEMKKEASIKQGTNKLTFMQNSLTYLNQRSFEPFIELINEGVEIEQTPKSGTDI
jgi:hypothetical protein